LVIKEILGSRMYLANGDKGISDQLIENGIREQASTNFLKSYLKKDHNVIDIGANIGYYALLEAKFSNRVYAIEPIKESFDLLNKSIKLNKYKNIEAFNFALGSENKKGWINLSTRSNWCSMLNMKKAPEKYREKFNIFKAGKRGIDVFTLNHFIGWYFKEDHIDLIRMDVEGYETEIIKTMDSAVKLMPKGAILSIEFHPVVFTDRSILVKAFESIIDKGFKVKILTTHDNEYNLNNSFIKKMLLEKGTCPQIFFEKL
jgi:FkbM family methyltransferase